ncbi:ATP-binding response regulator [Pulveribacter suum]|uniref:histidine kinase n=1 Tax=Pulveribacter suum TaxID=2116657 RepID=A0A2P1NHT0_9BURK|nr:hybrid sensor histidine kinase/response regulator [Pulveribacter suum]AVP56591.1 hypothetical protein C7H73_02130 [Pulveribacter suum]
MARAEAAPAPSSRAAAVRQRLMLTAEDTFAQVHDAAQRLRLERRMLDLLQGGMREVLVTSALVGPALVLWLTLPHIGVARALGPALALVLISLERVRFLRRMARERARRDDAPRRWARGLAWRVWLSGGVIALWCHFVIAIGTQELVSYLLALVTILAAGATAQFCSWPPVMWATISPLLLGMAVQLALSGAADHRVGAVFALFLWLVLGLAGLRFAQTLHNDMRTRLRNEDLLRELDRRRAQAEAAHMAKTRFFAAASHDLRQPLQALGLYLSVLEGRCDDVDTLARMDQCMGALDRLLAELLELSQLDAGQLECAPRPIALQPLLDRLASMYQAAARLKGLQLRVHPTAAWALSDPALLERALANLLANAIRYTSAGGVLLGVRAAGGADWRVCVFDTGIGIAQAEREAVFEEFVQLDNPERDPEQGSGLGLATVQRVAALLGHRTTLHSHVGRGSCFALQLPRAQPLADSQAGAPARAAITAPLHGRVLVVEDNAAARDALALLLRGWGLDVVTARDAAQAEEALAGPAPDAVLCDWRLPGPRDGLAVLREALRRHPALKLGALVTGENIETLRAQDAAFVLLRKPVRPLRLRALLASRLGHAAVGTP